MAGHARRLRLVALAICLGIVCAPLAANGQAATPIAALDVTLELVAQSLVDPVAVRASNDGSDRLFVAEKVGRVRIIENGTLLETPFIDLTYDTVANSPEQGLYDIAFHPQFATNGLVYVSHTQNYLAGALVVWEFRASADNPNVAEPGSGRPVIAIQRRAFFHNGGTIAFGPDGYLYVGVGEGLPYTYSWAPAVNLAQCLENLDGKLLRIDVNVPRNANGDATASYVVPANPFGGPITREYAYRADMDMMRGEQFPEIWAWGLRNPWGFSFDPATGDLYLPDVGTADREEINLQPFDSKGGENYGWDEMEGDFCHGQDCTGYTPPVYAYAHESRRCAVIGLAVSRSSALPTLAGRYLFADYCSGEVMALGRSAAGWDVESVLDIASAVPERQVSGGGSDHNGTVYLTTCSCAQSRHTLDPDDAQRQTGAVWRLVPVAPDSPESASAILAGPISPQWRFRVTIPAT